MASNSNNDNEPQLPENQSVATFAAGCFWGVELAFQRVLGVVDTKVGYAQGHVDHPTYKQVCSGKTGHVEAIKIVFDKNEVTYPQLLDVFWKIHDPTTLNRQKNDVGTQYRSGIYYHDEDQRKEALASKEEHQKTLRKPIVSEIEPAQRFWEAETYHQKYLQKGGQCADKGCNDFIRCYG
ncbi:Peptide-methionine s-oxide reductase, partial [Globisporangium splendens]